MSYLPDAQLHGQNLIVQYIIECRGRGHFLPYDDHRIITKWVNACEDADALLLILSELAPLYFARAATRTHPPSLQRLDQKVSKILEARRQRDSAGHFV